MFFVTVRLSVFVCFLSGFFFFNFRLQPLIPGGGAIVTPNARRPDRSNYPPVGREPGSPGPTYLGSVSPIGSCRIELRWEAVCLTKSFYVVCNCKPRVGLEKNRLLLFWITQNIKPKVSFCPSWLTRRSWWNVSMMFSLLFSKQKREQLLSPDFHFYWIARQHVCVWSSVPHDRMKDAETAVRTRCGSNAVIHYTNKNNDIRTFIHPYIFDSHLFSWKPGMSFTDIETANAENLPGDWNLNLNHQNHKGAVECSVVPDEQFLNADRGCRNVKCLWAQPGLSHSHRPRSAIKVTEMK